LPIYILEQVVVAAVMPSKISEENGDLKANVVSAAQICLLLGCSYYGKVIDHSVKQNKKENVFLCTA
jgi:hypothetical protein